MSDNNAAEELRALLQNQSFQAPATPTHSLPHSHTHTTTTATTARRTATHSHTQSTTADIPVLDELAALIGSLDSHTPTRPQSSQVSE
jgi:hypothetical protein